MSRYQCTEEQFLKDAKHHQMKHAIGAVIAVLIFMAAHAAVAELEAFTIPHPQQLVINCGE